MLNIALKGDHLGSQGFRYLLATGLSAGLTLSLPALFHEVFLLSEAVAVAIAFVIVFFVNFAVVKWFVFRVGGSPLAQLVKLGITSALLRGLEYVAFYALLNLLAWNYLVVLLLVLSISFCLKFTIQRTLVFSSS